MIDELILEPSSGKKYCVVCYEQIDQRAHLCNECNNYQDWRRYLQFSQLTLALLVALASVVSSIVINFDRFWPSAPPLNVSVRSVADDGIDVLFYNPDKVADTITGGQVRLPLFGTTKEVDFAIVPDLNNDGDALIQSETTRVVRFRAPGLGFFLKSNTDGSKSGDFLKPDDLKSDDVRLRIGANRDCPVEIDHFDGATGQSRSTELMENCFDLMTVIIAKLDPQLISHEVLPLGASSATSSSQAL